MAYEVTAARKRPQRFENLVGQEFVAATLKNSIAQGQIAHAYLFSGPRGCGKTSSARILAKALNCERGPTPEPCGVCPACVEITRGASIDVLEIDGASNTSVNDIRQIKDEVVFPPNSSRYKIYIIDEVHMLSTSAFNALLKTIEEPPPYIVFIFATTELHKVPATIKSRCQQFYFRLVGVEQIKELLRSAADEIGVRAEDEALYWLAREATGSVRDAYTLFDQVASFSGGEITWEKIRNKLGLVGTEKLNALFERCAEGDAAGALLGLNELFEAGVAIEQFITDAADYFRSLLFIKQGITKEALLGHAPERFSAKVLAAWNAQALERGLSLLLTLYRDVRYSLDPRFEVDLALSRLSYLGSWVSPGELRNAVEEARKALAGAAPAAGQGGSVPFDARGGLGAGQSAAPLSQQPAFAQPAFAQQQPQTPASPQPQAPAPAQAPPPEALSLETLSGEELQAAVVKALSSGNASLSAALSRTAGWSVSGAAVSAGVSSGFLFHQLSQEAPEIAACISRLCGREVRFQVNKTAQEEAPEEKPLPVQVGILRDEFKGFVTEE